MLKQNVASFISFGAVMAESQSSVIGVQQVVGDGACLNLHIVFILLLLPPVRTASRVS